MEEMDTPLGFWGPCGRDRDPHEGQRDPMGEMEIPLGRWRFCGDGHGDPMGGDGDFHGKMDTLWRRERVLNAELEQPADPAQDSESKGKLLCFGGLTSPSPRPRMLRCGQVG